jgi:hypothetical protein
VQASVLVGGLVASLIGTQLVCWLLGRLLRGAGVRLERWVAITGLCLPLVVLSPWWTSGALLVPTPAGVFSGPPKDPSPHAGLSDTTYQFLPWEAEVRRAFGEGHLPLWSDRLDGGSSPWVNPQAQAMSLIAVIARFFPLQHFLLAALALKLLVAFEGTVLLARRLSISPLAAASAGLAYSLGGGIMAWALFAHTSAAAWVPWVVLSLVCTVRSQRAGAVLAASVTVTLLLLAGHPEVALAGLALAVLVALWVRRPGKKGRAGLLRAACAVALGVCLSAVQLVPFAFAADGSQRSEDRQTRPASQFTAPSPWPGSWFAPASVKFFLAPLGPEVFGKAYEEAFRGPWDWPDALSGYAGLVALAGSAVALFSVARHRAAPFLMFALAAFGISCEFAPLERLGLAFPLLRVPAYERILLVGCLALALAGALGLDRLRKSRNVSPLQPAAACTGAMALGADHSVHAALLWAGIGFALLVCLRRPRQGLWIVLTVSVLDLVPWSERLLPRGDPALFFPPAALIDRLRPLAGDAMQGRTVGTGQLVYPGVLPAYGIAEVRPNNPLAPRDYIHILDWAFGFRPGLYDYYARFERPGHPLLDFLGVRAVVSNRFLANPPYLELVRDLQFDPYLLFTNPRALPRAFFPRAVAFVAPPRLEQWVRALRDGAIVALDPAPGEMNASGRWRGGFSAAQVFSSRPGAAAIAFAPAAEPRLLATSFLREGWRAEAGGRALAARTVNGCFLAVVVPAGVASIELRYLPRGFLLGAAMSVLAALVLAAYAFRPLRARQRLMAARRATA